MITLSDESEKVLFFGTLDQLKILGQQEGMQVQLTATGRTEELEREKKCRSFQNPAMTYNQILGEVMKDYLSVECNWGKRGEESIQEPIIQYEERDWDFLQRLASRLNNCLVEHSNGQGTMISLGGERRRQRKIDEETVMEWGIRQTHYSWGCHEARMAYGASAYLTIQSRENWEIGDYGLYEDVMWQVYEKQTTFSRGELLFTYELGRAGIFYRKTVCNGKLEGVRLEGIVRQVEKENVYVQLDIDCREGAEYPWKWVPQTNHFSYCMPELDTRVSLHFPTGWEKDGQAVIGKFDPYQNCYTDPQKREFTTLYKKRLSLYPEKLLLEGGEGNIGLVLEDASGIQLNSVSGISLQAAGKVQARGKRLSVFSPVEVVCKTPVSNLELCRDINLFAPEGVHTIGKSERECSFFWSFESVNNYIVKGGYLIQDIIET